MKFDMRNILIVLLFFLVVILWSSQKKQSVLNEQTISIPSISCSDEHSRDINFLLNTYESRFHEARVVTALKDSDCFKSYPSLIKNAQAVIDKENEILKIINKTEFASVEQIVEFEKDPLLLDTKLDKETRDMVIELTTLVVDFNEKMESRTQKELNKYFE